MKRTILVFAVLLITCAGCSKPESAPVPLTSDVTNPTSQQAEPTGDACVDACLARFPDGASKLETLDDCVVDSCQPIEESPSSGSCDAVGPGASRISYGVPATDSCIAATCCAQATACANDPSCIGLTACMDTCNANN